MSVDPRSLRTIRNVHVDDLPRVSALALAAFGEMWNAETLSTKIADTCSTFLVAVEDGHIAGFILAFTVLDEMDLQLLGVEPALRRRGTGGRLVAALVAQARVRGVRRIHLEVRPSNQAARAVYAVAGFRERGLRKAYYASPVEDALCLSYEVEGAGAD